VFVIPTLAVPDGFLPESRASLLADPRFQGVLTNPIKQHLGRDFVNDAPPRSGQRASVDAHLARVRSLHEAGVKLLIGSDAGSRQPTAHGIGVHREIELLAMAGLKPSEILAAATANAADAFRLADRGRIAPGLRADMILIRGDPTADVLTIRDIVRVWKSGVEVDRAAR
jgi:imidazolonepropionase-like amidohydrolase